MDVILYQGIDINIDIYTDINRKIEMRSEFSLNTKLLNVFNILSYDNEKHLLGTVQTHVTPHD